MHRDSWCISVKSAVKQLLGGPMVADEEVSVVDVPALRIPLREPRTRGPTLRRSPEQTRSEGRRRLRMKRYGAAGEHRRHSPFLDRTPIGGFNGYSYLRRLAQDRHFPTQSASLALRTKNTSKPAFYPTKSAATASSSSDS